MKSAKTESCCLGRGRIKRTVDYSFQFVQKLLVSSGIGVDDTAAVGPVPEGIGTVTEHPADAHVVCSGFHLSTLLVDDGSPRCSCGWIMGFGGL